MAYDGTAKGTNDEATKSYGTCIDNKTTEASDSVNCEWTGPWPELHIRAEKYVSVDVHFAIQSKVDLIGSAEVEQLSIEIMGIEDYTEQQANDFISETESSFLSSDQWATVIFLTGAAFAVLIGIAEILSSIPAAISASGFGWLCVAIGGAYVIFIATMLASLRNQGVGTFQQGLTLLTAGLGLLLLGAEAAATLKGLKPVFKGMLQYFTKYWRSTAKYAYSGRCNAMLFVTTMILLAFTIITYFAVVTETI